MKAGWRGPKEFRLAHAGFVKSSVEVIQPAFASNGGSRKVIGSFNRLADG